MFDHKEVIEACACNHFTMLKLLLEQGIRKCHKNPENIPQNLQSIAISEIKTAIALLVNDEYSRLGDNLNGDSDEHPDSVSIAYYLTQLQQNPKYKSSANTIADCLKIIQKVIDYHNTLAQTTIPNIITTSIPQPLVSSKISTKTDIRNQPIFKSQPKEKAPIVTAEEEMACCTMF